MTTDDVKPTLKALRTCRGQLDGIIGMIEEGRESVEVSNQILAAQAMLKRANKMVLIHYIDKCISEAASDPLLQGSKVRELAPVLEKLLGSA